VKATGMAGNKIQVISFSFLTMPTAQLLFSCPVHNLQRKYACQYEERLNQILAVGD
jgi:hypothetical protein